MTHSTQAGHRITTGPGRRRKRRLAAALAVIAPVLASTAYIAQPSEAALTAHSLVNPDTGFPTSYTDSNGLSLQLCLDETLAVNCLTTRDELLGVGADGEAFYASATADAATFTAEYALEAAYAGPGTGQEIVFARTRYGGTGRPLSTYTFTGPYGTDSCDTDARGRLPRSCTVDIGGLAGGEFESAMDTDRIGPFLTWDTFGSTGAGAPPAGYIGDPNVPHTVVGSPTGFNKFRVTGPDIASSCGLTPNCAETDQFLVAGQTAINGPVASLNVTRLDFGTVRTTATRSVRYTSVGTTASRITSAVLTGRGFTATSNTCTANLDLQPGQSCLVTIKYAATENAPASGRLTITDNTGTLTHAIPISGRGLAVAPRVVSRVPAPTASAVSRTGNIVVRFSEPVQGVRAGTFKLLSLGSGRTVSATLSHVGNRWTLNPRNTLASRTRFRAQLVGGKTAIRDLHNVVLASQSWTFRTR